MTSPPPAPRDVLDRRCCTNRYWPARCQSTGSSPADAIRHWSAEGDHPIEDLTAEDGLTPLPSWAPGAKAISDDGLVAEERVLHPALTMVPTRRSSCNNAGRRRRGTPPRSPSLAGKPGGLVPGLRCGPEHIDAHSAQGTPFSGTRCGNGFRREHGPVGRHNDGLTADAIAAVLTALPAPGARSRSRASGRPPRPPAVAGSRAAAPAAAVPRSQGETSGWSGDPARPARA